jgi:protein arginine kinase activator
MRKCSRCSKPATLHITELKGGDVHALHLCESCAHEYLTHVDVGQADDEAEEFLKPPKPGEEESDEVSQLVCPGCGISFKEFRAQGRLGCPQCYVVFETELLPLLENIHGETQHTGKVPRRAPAASRRQYELIRLRNQLRSAVEAESYEDAARLRDEIQKLDSSLADHE